MKTLLETMDRLRLSASRLSFGAPVAHVYNPLAYAWPVARAYVERYGSGPKDAVLLGMNPGPFGMGQTGVPFGEVRAVRDYLGLAGAVGTPKDAHPKRPVLGFASTRSEVSGRRLWGAIEKRHPRAEGFFARAFVLNYCPLLFLDENGANVTPDKIALAERKKLEALCDAALADALAALSPRHIVGIGNYAARRASLVTGRDVVVMPHPSPASPLANRDWEGSARAALAKGGVRDLL